MRLKCVSSSMKNISLPDGTVRTFGSDEYFDCSQEVGDFLINKFGGKNFKVVPKLPEIPEVKPKRSFEEFFQAKVGAIFQIPDVDDIEIK